MNPEHRCSLDARTLGHLSADHVGEPEDKGARARAEVRFTAGRPHIISPNTIAHVAKSPGAKSHWNGRFNQGIKGQLKDEGRHAAPSGAHSCGISNDNSTPNHCIQVQ